MGYLWRRRKARKRVMFLASYSNLARRIIILSAHYGEAASMLPSCYWRLSRATCTRLAAVSCKKYYSPTDCPMHYTPIVNPKSLSAPSTYLPQLSSCTSPHPSYQHCMLDAATIQSTWRDPVFISRRGIPLRPLYPKLDLEVVSNGLTLKHDSSLGRMFSSVSSEAKRNRTAQIVVVVESPTKAKTVQRFLGSDFVVLPSHGPVRGLAARAGSVRPENDYAMMWEVLAAAQPHLTRIKDACARYAGKLDCL
ncbi:hypothetical protein L7F22_018006 [Adiantum nelumboides]|nr:hypothetical protein [Adiantum nelumboides]